MANTHARKQLRDSVKEILDNGNHSWTSVLGTRITTKRMNYPYLMVYADSEPSIETNIHSPTIYERELSINVVAMMKVNDPEKVEDQIDDICYEIESKLTTTNLRAKHSAKDLRMTLTGSSFVVAVDELDVIDHAEVIMEFEIKYFTTEGIAQTLL